MIWFILGFIASYIIGIVGWSIIFIIGDNYIETFDDLKEELCDSLGFIPGLNIIFLAGFIIVAVIAAIAMIIYKCCGIEKLWNKIKDKKLPFIK